MYRHLNSTSMIAVNRFVVEAGSVYTAVVDALFLKLSEKKTFLKFFFPLNYF